ncbi:hypothetical protein [Meiothermus cerbereus]|jgi:uncharacterized membrane protein YccF (DUF307 family)|uniref:hypothetical protein n=1 Tax=Meiothermus cerbereus TaxID=65552 RepID=UPI0004877263|nr:hypothetical protein [Meiothermus cerbereus]
MTEGAVLFLRLLLWLLPGILAFLAVRGLLAGRTRVGLGLIIAGVLAAFLIKPIPVGLAFFLIGGLAALGGGRNPRYARELHERIEEWRK